MIYVPTNFNGNVICFSSLPHILHLQILHPHSHSEKSVLTAVRLSYSLFPSSNTVSNSHNSKETFSEFESL